MIRVNNVSKTYMLWQSPLSRLLVPIAHRLIRPWLPKWYESYYRRHCEPVKALQNISFELAQGDSLGIIGLNGSGKSTLLQIIAGTLPATTGSVEVEGRVAALLELGSGFDPEFTGRENVFLNAAILGLSREETEARYADIVAFADIGESIDRQVKTYSTGMMVRLAFAVQVHVDPDILIVDEALAVGDARFQAKALTRLDAILAKGTTLLFVGHDLNTVKSFCNRAMLLRRGEVVMLGMPDDVITDYLYQIQSENFRDRPAPAKTEHGFGPSDTGVISASIVGFGDHASLTYDSSIQIEIELQLGSGIEHPYLIFDIVDAKGLQLTGRRLPIPDAEGTRKLLLDLRCAFQQGIYRFRFRIVDAPALESTLLISRQDDLLSMELIDDVREQFTGLFPVPMKETWLTDS